MEPFIQPRMCNHNPIVERQGAKSCTFCLFSSGGTRAFTHVAARLISKRLRSLRKKPALPLILGGAAVYRCGNCLVLNSALAAEGAALDQELLFPQALTALAPLVHTRSDSCGGSTPESTLILSSAVCPGKVKVGVAPFNVVDAHRLRNSLHPSIQLFGSFRVQ